MPIGHVPGKLCMRRVRRRAMYETGEEEQGKLIMLEHPASQRGPNTSPLRLRALAGAAVCSPAIMSRASPTAQKATNPQSHHHS